MTKYEAQQHELLVRLREYIEGSYIGQVYNITRQMQRLAQNAQPEDLRNMAPDAWLKAFVNGELSFKNNVKQ